MHHSLVYISSAKASFTDKDLAGVLTESRLRNSGLGITGILLHVGGNFMQALEGDEPLVRSLYDRISADDRHRNVKELVSFPAEQRLFGEWSMAFRESAHLPPDQRDGVSSFIEDTLDKDDIEERRPAAMRLLETFARTMR